MLLVFPRPYPHGPLHVGISLCPEAQMGTRRGAIWSSPKTLKPHPQCLVCLTPITPFFSAPWVFICSLSVSPVASCLYTESQPARSVATRPPLLPLVSFGLGDYGAGRKSVSFQLKVIMTIVSLQSMFPLDHSWNSWAGGWGEGGTVGRGACE